MRVALITVADGVCHPTSAALIISRQRRHSIYTHTAAVQIANERMKTMIRDGEIGPEQSATVYLIAGVRAGLVPATGGDSAGVSQTDAGRPWAM